MDREREHQMDDERDGEPLLHDLGHIDMRESNTRATCADNWQGGNLLGFALMDVRDQLGI